jgi:RNA polymerase sigma factor (sigma-70 family)
VSGPPDPGEGESGRRWTSFEEFYRARIRWAGRYTVLALGDTGLAEELVQDTFEKAARNWHRLEKPDAWLLAVLSRQIAREAARRRRQRTALDRVAGSARAWVIDPDQQIYLREDYRQVREAIDALPGQQRVVVLLRLVYDLTDAEIADALGVSASTVNTHAKRGIDKLRRTFGRHGERLMTQLTYGGTASYEGGNP